MRRGRPPRGGLLGLVLGGEVDGGGEDGGGARHGGRVQTALFAEVFGQCVAAEGDADGVDFAVVRGEQAEHVGNFAGVAAVVFAFGGNAAATSEMGDDAVPAARLHGVHEFDGVVAAAAAFEAVEEDDQRRVGVGRVDEIVGGLVFAVAVGQQLAAVGGRRALPHLGVDALQVAADEPAGAAKRRQVGKFVVV